MFTKLYNRLRVTGAPHIPHRYLYAALAVLSLAGCLGLDKTLCGACAALFYWLLSRKG